MALVISNKLETYLKFSRFVSVHYALKYFLPSEMTVPESNQ